MRTAMLVAGAICAAAGLLTGVLGGFGMPNGQDTALQISKLGFDGLDNLTVLPAGYVAIPLLIVGIGLLVAANATAYKETGGY